jgi:hypothetical protein
MTSPINPEVVRWVNQQVEKYGQELGMAPGGPRETEILRFWRLHRPIMFRNLSEAGLATKLAFVLDRKRYEAKKEYLRAGWPPTDAEEQAQKEWLLKEPESDKSHSPPLFDQISSLMIPSG